MTTCHGAAVRHGPSFFVHILAALRASSYMRGRTSAHSSQPAAGIRRFVTGPFPLLLTAPLIRQSFPAARPPGRLAMTHSRGAQGLER